MRVSFLSVIVMNENYSVRLLADSSSKFTLRLPVALDFERSGVFECALLEVYIGEPKNSQTVKVVFIECDSLFSGSIFNQEIHPVLSIIPTLGPGAFDRLYTPPYFEYKRIKVPRVESLSFTLKDQLGNKLEFVNSSIYLHIHFRPCAVESGTTA